MQRRTLTMICGAALAAACGDKGDEGDTGAATTATATASAGDTSGPGDGGDEADGGTGADAGDDEGPGDTGGDDGGTGTGGDDTSFVGMPDGGGSINECDVWAQDCPEGEKCMPWAADGGSSWNGTRCAEEAANPKEPGDECMTDGSDVSGNDDCRKGSMCFSVNPETDVGTCVEFCQGSPDAPTCTDSETQCQISNDGVLILCLGKCDPLLQDCPVGAHQAQGCYPVGGDGFFCWPDFSFDLGAYADPCEYFNVCDPGLFCAIPELVPGCIGASGCCDEYCDLADADAGMSCAGAGDGQECVPFYDMGQAPPGLDGIGACGIP